MTAMVNNLRTVVLAAGMVRLVKTGRAEVSERRYRSPVTDVMVLETHKFPSAVSRVRLARRRRGNCKNGKRHRTNGGKHGEDPCRYLCIVCKSIWIMERQDRECNLDGEFALLQYLHTDEETRQDVLSNIALQDPPRKQSGSSLGLPDRQGGRSQTRTKTLPVVDVDEQDHPPQQHEVGALSNDVGEEAEESD